MKHSNSVRQAAQITHFDSSTFVPAAPLVRQLPSTPIHSPTLVDLLPPAAHSGHARMDDNAISHAKATLLVSAAYIVAAGMITVGLLLIIWLWRGLGDGWATYTYTGLILWGSVSCLRYGAIANSPCIIAPQELLIMR